MTDHSILTPGLPDLPFRKEAELLSRVFAFITNLAPKVRTAIKTGDLVAFLDDLSDAQLSEIGIARTDIPVFAARKTGLLG